jgi:hypothetical protein
MVGNDDYKSALGFNALFFYGRALRGVKTNINEVVLPVVPPNDPAEILPSLTSDCSSPTS